jgi:PHD/YefM family antitoxin component YafN of YafNO toxin-antitoxin module
MSSRAGELPPPFSIGEFRLELPRILERFHAEPTAGPVTVGRHRRVEAVILSPAEYERLAGVAQERAGGAEENAG